MADIGIVAVDQVAVNVLLAGFAQVAVVFQQLDVLAFLTSAIGYVRGVKILSAAIDTAVQLDIAVFDLPSEEVNERQSIRGEYIEKDKTVFYDFAEMLFNEQLELNEIRQSTYDRKMATLKMLSAISDYEIQDMDEKMIKDFFIKNLYYSQSSIDKMYQLLSFVFKKAVSKKIILESPMRDFKRPKSKQEQIPVRALTIDEQAALLKVLKEHDILYSDIMLLAVFTGMRIGECCALTVEDINFNEKTIRINKTVSRGVFGGASINEPKTKSGIRTLYVNDEIIQFLREVIGN